jgi:hypothetical protein
MSRSSEGDSSSRTTLWIRDRKARRSAVVLALPEGVRDGREDRDRAPEEPERRRVVEQLRDRTEQRGDRERADPRGAVRGLVVRHPLLALGAEHQTDHQRDRDAYLVPREEPRIDFHRVLSFRGAPSRSRRGSG